MREKWRIIEPAFRKPERTAIRYSRVFKRYSIKIMNTTLNANAAIRPLIFAVENQISSAKRIDEQDRAEIQKNFEKFHSTCMILSLRFRFI